MMNLSYVKPDIVFTVWLGLGQIEFLREFLNFLYYNNFCSGVQSEEQNIHPTQYWVWSMKVIAVREGGMLLQFVKWLQSYFSNFVMLLCHLNYI